MEKQAVRKGSKEEHWHTDQGEIKRKGAQYGRDQRRKAGTQTRVRSWGRASSTEGIKGEKLVERLR